VSSAGLAQADPAEALGQVKSQSPIGTNPSLSRDDIVFNTLQDSNLSVFSLCY
jgi:hypothetical protein